MKIFLDVPGRKPKVSFVLLDWSCRESFHMLQYLNDQDTAREDYEILWIEYYSRRAAGIDAGLRAAAAGRPPIVDQWLALGMAETAYYHKHLMYNVGIVRSRGDIVVLCDSDAMVRPSFVRSIMSAFDEHPEIVLHLDEVRNTDRRLYPFRFPTFDEVLGPGVINWSEGKTAGLSDSVDPLHTRNYGACMAARRRDLIAIGGADEHIDYLGHICGPYELTFRLVNAGLTEIWHPSEFLYHTWHPGTDGHANYMGPHDGRGLSTTALSAIRSGRIVPLVENSAVRLLRNGEDILYVEPEACLLPRREAELWTESRIKNRSSRKSLLHIGLIPAIWVLWFLFRATAIQVLKKAESRLRIISTPSTKEAGPALKKTFYDKVRLAFAFCVRTWRNNAYALEASHEVANRLSRKSITHVAICGPKPLADVLHFALARSGILIDVSTTEAALEALRGYRGKIVIAALLDVAEIIDNLKAMGIARENIIRLQ